MKVLFLDFDGVICLSNNWGSRFKKQKKWGKRKMSMSFKDIPVEFRFDNFDNKAIKVLNEIIDKTNTEIVISSDWRHHATLTELQQFFVSQGVNKLPIDTTGNIENITPEFWKTIRNKANLEIERSIEIQDWLKKHPEITNWVAVDDLNMSVEFITNNFHNEMTSGLTNFVLTPKSNEGIKQTNLKEKIINFLT